MEMDFNPILRGLQIPEMSGLEATRAIRERETTGHKRTCIIGLTAYLSVGRLGSTHVDGVLPDWRSSDNSCI